MKPVVKTFQRVLDMRMAASKRTSWWFGNAVKVPSGQWSQRMALQEGNRKAHAENGNTMERFPQSLVLLDFAS